MPILENCEMTIRRFEKGDFEACARLLMETYNAPPWNDAWTAETAGKYIDEFTRYARFVGFVAVIDGSIEGAAFLREKTWIDGSELYVDEFYVSPRRQGRGIGKALFAHIEAYAEENGLESITLLTDKRKPAFRFYRKNGMAESENTVFMYK